MASETSAPVDSTSAGAPRRRVLFVCHANTGRSVIAEAVLRRMLADRGVADVTVRSGGIAPYARDTSLVSLDARLVLRDLAIELPENAMSCDLKRHREHLAQADVIVVMTAQQRDMLGAFDEARGKHVATLRELAGESGDIDDPAGRGAEFYAATGDEIRRLLEKAFARLVGREPAP